MALRDRLIRGHHAFGCLSCCRTYGRGTPPVEYEWKEGDEAGGGMQGHCAGAGKRSPRDLKFHSQFQSEELSKKRRIRSVKTPVSNVPSVPPTPSPTHTQLQNPLPFLCLGDESYPRRYPTPSGREGQKFLKYKTPSPLPTLIFQPLSHNTPVNLTGTASSQNITNMATPTRRHLRPHQS